MSWRIISSGKRWNRIIRIRRVETKGKNQDAKIRMLFPLPLIKSTYLSCLVLFIAFIKFNKNKNCDILVYYTMTFLYIILWHSFILYYDILVYYTLILRHNHVSHSLNFSSCPLDLYVRANFGRSSLTTTPKWISVSSVKAFSRVSKTNMELVWRLFLLMLCLI